MAERVNVAHELTDPLLLFWKSETANKGQGQRGAQRLKTVINTKCTLYPQRILLVGMPGGSEAVHSVIHYEILPTKMQFP